MTALLWPAVVFTLGVLVVLLIHQSLTLYLREKEKERLNVTEKAQLLADFRKVQDEVQELRDAVTRIEMASGLRNP